MKPRVLVIDDEEGIRSSLKMTLEYDGCEVLLAATGEEGVKLVEREAPDLVFLDIKMPGMDGLEVLQKLRHLVETVPIVIISGHADISTAVEATRLGAFDFIEKPLASDVPALVAHLDVLLLGGQMSSEMRSIVEAYVSDVPLDDDGTQRVTEALYLITTSPEGALQR